MQGKTINSEEKKIQQWVNRNFEKKKLIEINPNK